MSINSQLYFSFVLNFACGLFFASMPQRCPRLLLGVG